MNRPIILSEDSTGGLYLWALLNEYVFNNAFDLRFANTTYFSHNITLSDFDDNSKNKQTLTLSSPPPTSGYQLIEPCFQRLSSEDTVILAIDSACDAAVSFLTLHISQARQRGVAVHVIGYNCAMDILLSYKYLPNLYYICRRKERDLEIEEYKKDTSKNINYDILLNDIRQAIMDGKIGQLEVIAAVQNLSMFQEHHREACLSSLTGDFSMECTFDYFMNLYTRDSRIFTNKYGIGRCFSFDCGYLEMYCCMTCNVGQKLLDIYNNSVLCHLMERAAQALNISFSVASTGRSRKFPNYENAYPGVHRRLGFRQSQYELFPFSQNGINLTKGTVIDSQTLLRVVDLPDIIITAAELAKTNAWQKCTYCDGQELYLFRYTVCKIQHRNSDIYSYISRLASPEPLQETTPQWNQQQPNNTPAWNTYQPQPPQSNAPAPDSPVPAFPASTPTSKGGKATSAFDKLKGQNLPDHTHEFD